MPTFRKRRIDTENDSIINDGKLEPKNQKGSFGFFRLIKLLIWVSIISLIFFYYSYSSFLKKEIIENDLIINIEENDNLSNLGNKIEELNNFWYKFYLKNNPPEFSLKKGTYKLEGGANIEKIISSLDTPILNEENITILEGWNVYDIDEYLTKKGLIKSGDYENYVINIENIKIMADRFDFIDKQATLEGFLYPDTYRILTSNFDIGVFVSRQLVNFEDRVYNKILKNHDVKTITDVINLASIVEKEERNINEKSTVAGILKKRLNAGWMIGADITVCYPYKLTFKECNPSFIGKHINEKNDYNTRTMTGLPKTPIGNPNFETINATLNHKETKYWFYLHNENTGKIYYAETNREHEANKIFMY